MNLVTDENENLVTETGEQLVTGEDDSIGFARGMSSINEVDWRGSVILQVIAGVDGISLVTEDGEALVTEDGEQLLT